MGPGVPSQAQLRAQILSEMVTSEDCDMFDMNIINNLLNKIEAAFEDSNDNNSVSIKNRIQGSKVKEISKLCELYKQVYQARSRD